MKPMKRLAEIPRATGAVVLDLDESAWDEPMVHIHQPRFESAPYIASIPAWAILDAADEIRRSTKIKGRRP